MRLHRVVVRELLHYRWNSLAGLLAVMLAVGAIAGTALLLGAYETDSARALDAEEQQLQRRLTDLRTDVEDSLGRLGFNLTLLPEGQDPADWYVQDDAPPTWAEADVQRLREAELPYVRNPVGQLRRRVTWPERQWSVIVVGRAELPMAEGGGVSAPLIGDVAGADEPAPLATRFVQPPAPGHVVLGHEIHRVLEYSEGDAFELMGRTFRVQQCLPQEGSRDDISVRMTLKDAQALLEIPGRVSEILAQGTRAAWEDPDGLRQQVRRVLPGTEVVQHTTESAAASLAALHVNQTERQRIEQERAAQADLNHYRRQLAGLVNLLVVLSCGLWIGWLAWNNVAERRVEIGVWRACGLRAQRLVAIFLGRWVCLGILGTAAGLLAAAFLTPLPAGAAPVRPDLLPAVLGVAILLSGLAAATAALAAAREDPAAAFRSG